MLPVNQNDEIDYDLMETYIRAIEKKVIKNVVDWKDTVPPRVSRDLRRGRKAYPMDSR